MRRKFAIAVIALSCLAGCSQTTPPDSKNAAAEQWNGARAAVLYSLANDQFKTGNYDKSRKTVAEALRMSPQNAELWILSAKLNIEQSQLELAQQDLGRAMEFAPDTAEPYYLRGVINQRWQKLEDAATDYQIASDKAPTELAYVLARAETLVAMDRSKEALSLLQEKQPYFENNPVIRDAAGQLLMQQKRYSEAVDTFRKASMLATDDLGIKERLAKALLFNNQHREAAEMLSRLTRDDRNMDRADLFVMLGEACMQADRPSEARAAFETATQVNPSSALAWQGVGKVALNASDLRRAELAIRKSVSLDPADSQSQLLLGYLRLKQSKLNEAMVAFRKAAALDDGDAVALCMTGYVFEQMGDQDQAMAFYAKALKLRPGDEMATKLMANIGLNE
jgi:tetratricopeptide (TPR) repeat protein